MYTSRALAILLPLCLIPLTTSAALRFPPSFEYKHTLQDRTTNAPSSADPQQSRTSNTSLNGNALLTSAPFPVADNLALKFNILGIWMPVSSLEFKLRSARESIRSDVDTKANAPIAGNLWAYGQFPEVQLGVAAYDDQTVTYSQLAHVLDGLTEIMTGAGGQNSRNTAYDIVWNGRDTIGYGLVWYGLPTTVGGAANGTSLGADPLQVSPSLLNASVATGANSRPTWVPIGRTSMRLYVNYFGDPLPSSAFEEAFCAMNLEIIDHVIPSSNRPIPDNRIIYDKSNTHISFIGDRGRSISWLQLFQILQGLYAFVSGLIPYSPHYQTLRYDIWLDGSTQFGTGSLWYNPPTVAVS